MAEYELITCKDDLLKYLPVVRQAKVLAVDTETTGLDPHTNRIRLLQISIPNLPVLVIDCFVFLPEGLDVLKDILETHAVKVFQNAKFDLQFLIPLGIYPSPIFDTMLAGQLLRTSGGSRYANLAALAEHYLNETVSKGEQKSDWSGELSRNQLDYAARDADILLRLREVMVRKIYENNLSDIARIEFSCVRAMAEMEYTGVGFDSERWKRLTLHIEKERDNALRMLYKFTGEPIVQLNIWNEDIVLDQNFDSNAFILKLLRSNGIQVESTSKGDLSVYSAHPLVQGITAYRKATKSLTSFLYPMPKMIHARTGRLHPRYGQIGAWSGRMSCGNPNIQQIPRDSEFRACFVAPPNRKLVIADYSQIELRVAAEITRDPRMLAAYNAGEDLHTQTASLLLDKPMETISKKERQAAKAVNFGLIYAMGAAGLAQYAEQSYGVDMTLEQANEFRNRFFKSYTGIDRWNKSLKRNPPQEARSLTGRKYAYSPNTGLAGLSNTPVQGTAADIVKKALGMLAGRLSGTNTRIIGVVHDEIILETSNETADEMGELLKHTMEEAGSTVLRQVPCKADVTISQSWSKL